MGKEAILILKQNINFYSVVDLHEHSELVQFPIHCLSVYHHLECQELDGHHQLLFQ